MNFDERVKDLIELPRTKCCYTLNRWDGVILSGYWKVEDRWYWGLEWDDDIRASALGELEDGEEDYFMPVTRGALLVLLTEERHKKACMAYVTKSFRWMLWDKLYSWYMPSDVYYVRMREEFPTPWDTRPDGEYVTFTHYMRYT